MASSCKPMPPGTPDEAPEGQTWLCLVNGETFGTHREQGCAQCPDCVLVYKHSLMYEDGVLIKAEAVHDPEAEITW